MAFTAELNINWSMLRDQKKALLEIMDDADGRLDGLLELIDFIQDCGELAGEPVEWLSEDEEDE